MNAVRSKHTLEAELFAQLLDNTDVPFDLDTNLM